MQEYRLFYFLYFRALFDSGFWLTSRKAIVNLTSICHLLWAKYNLDFIYLIVFL